MVSRVGTGILLMEKGATKFYGTDVSYGIDKYYEGFIENKNNKAEFDHEGDVVFIEIQLGDKPDNSKNIFSINRLDDLHVKIKIKVKDTIGFPCLALTVFDKEQRPIGVSINENGLNDKNIYIKENDFVFYSTKLNNA